MNNSGVLIEILKNNLYKTLPSYEKLQGDLKGAYLRRINIKHRLVYEEDKIIKIISLCSHILALAISNCS